MDDDITCNVANDDSAATTNDDMVTSSSSSSSSSTTDSVYTTLGNVSEFTSLIHYGYHLYASALRDLLRRQQRPIVAPVGLCYLLVHDENYPFWCDKLFCDDGYHPSPHGTFVMGATLYASIYGRLPILQRNYDRSSSLQYLWSRALKMQMSDMGTSKPYPSWEEAQYLLSIVKRIVPYGEQPRSLLSF